MSASCSYIMKLLHLKNDRMAAGEFHQDICLPMVDEVTIRAVRLHSVIGPSIIFYKKLVDTGYNLHLVGKVVHCPEGYLVQDIEDWCKKNNLNTLWEKSWKPFWSLPLQ